MRSGRCGRCGIPGLGVAQAWPSPVGEYPPESIGAGPGGGGGVAVDAVIEGG